MSDPRAWLDAVDARTNAATDGPWTELYPGQCCSDTCIEAKGGGPLHDGDLNHPDARFIAHARTDLPAATTALRAVLDLHTPRACTSNPWDAVQQRCDEDDQPFPCPTVTAITTALTQEG